MNEKSAHNTRGGAYGKYIIVKARNSSRDPLAITSPLSSCNVKTGLFARSTSPPPVT